MDDWKPIETAPNDGTKILIWERGSIYEARWDDALLRTTVNGRTITIYGWMTVDSTGAKKPSHWMPLPKPPAL